MKFLRTQIKINGERERELQREVDKGACFFQSLRATAGPDREGVVVIGLQEQKTRTNSSLGFEGKKRRRTVLLELDR